VGAAHICRSGGQLDVTTSEILGPPSHQSNNDCPGARRFSAVHDNRT
jgi:hypothetical protein